MLEVKFAGYQEAKGRAPQPMFVVYGHDKIAEGDTVLLETLVLHGLSLSDFMSYVEWKEAMAKWKEGDKYPPWGIISKDK